MALNTVSSLLSGLFNSNANSNAQMLSFKQNKALQENQAKVNYEYAEKSARNTPTWNRSGLENAGYNPMLAVQNATSGANSSWAGSAHADSPMQPDYFSNGVANAVDAMRLRNETDQVESTIRTQEATARNQNAEAANKESENPFIGRKAEAEIGKMTAETTKLNRETEYFDALEKNLEEMRRIQEMGINLDYKSSIYSANKAYNASTYTANKNNEMKTLSQYAGKWTEDKLQSLKGSRFGRDVARLGRLFYKQ